ncbi:hypothetical protein L7F22_009745 [Adiantum nelumboides]|nr:hypothetical protein [Adiantum nelumboides]
MPATSDPVPGSVTAIAATASPEAIGPSQRRCWSGLPWRTRWGAAMYPLTSAVTAIPPVALLSSSASSATARASASEPPCSSGVTSPSRPAAPRRFHSCIGIARPARPRRPAAGSHGR